jgi:hypothetical protein
MTPDELKEYQRIYYQKNKAKWPIYKEKWIRNNPEANRESKQRYRTRNKANRKAYNKQWASRNRGLVTSYARAYQAAKLRATPPWLSEAQKAEIEQFYINRPDGFHVDHIVPLKGKTVCGLHVPWNLQYLPATENIRKSNKLK